MPVGSGLSGIASRHCPASSHPRANWLWPPSRRRWTGGYIFENEWQSFRTRQNRDLELTTPPHIHAKAGRYTRGEGHRRLRQRHDDAGADPCRMTSGCGNAAVHDNALQPECVPTHGMHDREAARACTGRPRPPACSCAHGPYGSCRWDRETSPGRSISPCRPSAHLPRGSIRARPRPAAISVRRQRSCSADRLQERALPAAAQ